MPALCYPRPSLSLAPAAAALTLARHTPCAACDCPGQRPVKDAEVELRDGDQGAADGDDEAEAWRWDCRCACERGHVRAEEDEERSRRLRVANRIDDLINDAGHLDDFEWEDEDVTSLRKQMAPSGRTLSRAKRGRSVSEASSASLSSAAGTLSRAPSPRHAEPDEPLVKRRRLVGLVEHASTSSSSRASSSGPLTPQDDVVLLPSVSNGDGEGHGKRPARSQKGLPDGAGSTEAAAQPEVEPAPPPSKDEVAQGADLDLASKGVSIDTGDTIDPDPPRKERPAVIEERAGLIQFRVVENDGQPESMIVLTGLKNIFQRQLPMMPREYITRLVLDRNHRSLAIVKRGLHVVGGITYRPFDQHRFAEIVFCAITSTEQVKGYGNHLMNHLKDHVKASSEVMHFLTYADNYAIGYFKKQGFTKEITLPRPNWVGYIKDYEGGTLMQCSMVPRVRYLSAQDLLISQRRLVLEKIRQISRSHIVHRGLKVFREQAGADDDDDDDDDEKPLAESGKERKPKYRIDPSLVPGLKESGWTPEMDELSRRPKRGPHHSLMRHILAELNNHQSAWPFVAPVDANSVADYYKVIQHPMDLGTMETKLENNAYATVEDLTADVRLIAFNCRTYNGASNQYTKLANQLERHFDKELPGWKQSYGIL